MDDSLRQVLSDIIKKRGLQICENPRLVRALLSDLCPSKKAEINLIYAALEFGIYTKLKTIDKSLVTVSLDTLSSQFEHDYGKKTVDARWAMGVWSTVLEYMSEDEFRRWHPSPPTITTLKPLITQDSVIMRGELHSRGTADEVTASFLFGANAKDYSRETPTFPVNTVGPFSAEPVNIGQFQFGRSYFCKAKAIGDKEAISDKGVRFLIPHRLAVTTLIADKVTANSAILKGKLDSIGDEKSVSCSFELVSADASISKKTESVRLTSSGGYEIDLHLLIPGTSYRFRAVVKGQKDASGLWVDFATQKINPVILTGEADISLRTAKFYCEVESFGTETELALSIEYGTVKGNYIYSSRSVLTKTIGKFTFDMPNLTADTHYYYRVKAKGFSEWFGVEKQFYVPAISPSLTIANISTSGTTAIIKGKLNSLGTSDVVTMQVVYRKSGTNTYSKTNIIKMDATGNFAFKLLELQPETKYSFMVEVDGPHGYSSSEHQFVTRINIPTKRIIKYIAISVGMICLSTLILIELSKKPPIVETLDPSGVDGNSAVLWAKIDELGSSSSVKLSFEWGTESGKYIGQTIFQTVNKRGSYSTSLADLGAGSYYYRSKAIGDKTAYGEEKKFNISFYQPPIIATDECENSHTSAILKGNLSSLGSSGIVNTSFVWWSDPTYPNETMVQKKDYPGTFNTKLTDLKPNTKYYYQAKTQSDREIVTGDIKSFLTATSPPSIVTGIGSATAFSALLRASLSSTGTASQVAVSFEYGIDPNKLTKQTIEETVSGAFSFSHKILNLSPGTTYYFRAKAVGDGISYGDIKQVRTTIGNESPYQ